MFYTYSDAGQFVLLDGDRIACLLARLISRLLLQQNSELRFGVVQTAYANGASTDFLSSLPNADIECTSTGVKYLHHSASLYDIGLYFEPNGHGTILLSSKARSQLPSLNTELFRFCQIANEYVGDAISDMLLVLVALSLEKLSVREWNDLYKERASSLLKVAVPDRYLIQTKDADRQIEKPVELQHKIDALVASYGASRAFARPSGTEDYVRIYAEAGGQQDAQSLAHGIAQIIGDYFKQ